MPWKASSVMEERLRFVARLLDGEAKGGIGGLGHLSGVRRSGVDAARMIRG